ncbi:MAG TPA: penicillin-binding protein 1C [Verrucomicrobiota bacterium]|nr:penicillin-binding protein 1C [Verrucomicrobiota bacterium]
MFRFRLFAANPRRRLLLKAGAAMALSTAALAVGAWYALRWVPLPRALWVPPAAQVEMVDRNGAPLRIARSEGGTFARPAGYADVPQALIHATLAAEDRRFWSHGGVDWRASLRAGLQFLRHRRVVSGGSTITQQLIKLAEPRPRTLRTKVIEAVQALRLEQVWDKQHILLEYLNRLDYGRLNTGCAAAAQACFGKPLRDLSVAECALLAGLPQGPTRLDPRLHPGRALHRQRWILARMLECGFLSRAEFERAAAEPIALAPPGRAFRAPHFVDLLLSETRTQPPAAGGRVVTSLDLELNQFVQGVVRRQLARLAEENVQHAAVVVMENRSGEVLALVGSADYFSPRQGQVNGAWAPRSAGSTFKPFTYLIAFEQGATPASIVPDLPAEFATATGVFAPLNYDQRFHGPMRYRLALGNSLNVSAVKVLASLGGPAVLKARLTDCGLTTLTRPAEEYGLGLTLGNAEARLLELANAYACLARLGQYQPFALLRAPAVPGRPAAAAKPPPLRVFDPAAAFLLADILSDNAARTLAFGPESALRFDFPVACKTGTSSGFRDNWAFGYTPEFTVGVWAGNFDGSPMRGVSGVTGAAPILHEVFEHLHQRHGTTWYPTPETVVEAPIHPLTGKRLASAPSPGRPRLVEKFHAAHLPPFEAPGDYDSQGRVRLPAEYAPWLGTGDNWLGDTAVADSNSSSPRILFPPPGTVIYLDPDLPDAGRRLPLRAAGAGRPDWRSETLAFEQAAGRVYALLVQGTHRLQLHDPATGARAETWFEVRAK